MFSCQPPCAAAAAARPLLTYVTLGRCERVRANLGTTRARGEVDMEITLRKMQHKEDKMQRTASQFQEMEQTVYNSLFTLIKDTSVLRDYAAAALLIINVSSGRRWCGRGGACELVQHHTACQHSYITRAEVRFTGQCLWCRSCPMPPAHVHMITVTLAAGLEQWWWEKITRKLVKGHTAMSAIFARAVMCVLEGSVMLQELSSCHACTAAKCTRVNSLRCLLQHMYRQAPY